MSKPKRSNPSYENKEQKSFIIGPPIESGKSTKVQRINKLIFEIQKRKKVLSEMKQLHSSTLENLNRQGPKTKDIPNFKPPQPQVKAKKDKPNDHWDFLLLQMEWMANHFLNDFKLKHKNAAKLAIGCVKGSKNLLNLKLKRQKKAEQELKKKASIVGRSVLVFWKAMQKIVEHNYTTIYRQNREKERRQRMFEFVNKQMELSSDLAEDIGQIKVKTQPKLLPQKQEDEDKQQDDDESQHSSTSSSELVIRNSNMIAIGVGNPTTQNNPAHPYFDQPIILELQKVRQLRRKMQQESYLTDSISNYTLQVMKKQKSNTFEAPFLIKHALRDYQLIGLGWL